MRVLFRLGLILAIGLVAVGTVRTAAAEGSPPEVNASVSVVNGDTDLSPDPGKIDDGKGDPPGGAAEGDGEPTDIDFIIDQIRNLLSILSGR